MATVKPATVNFEFPLWVIMPPTFRMGDIAMAAVRDGTKGILLFTDEVNAKEFLDANSNFPGNALRIIIDPWHFFGLLALAEKAGFAHVFIDPAPTRGSRPASGSNAIPLASLRALFEEMAL